MPHRARQVRKWFTRRVLRFPGGVRYDDLPRRLRETWYTYHKASLARAAAIGVGIFFYFFVRHKASLRAPRAAHGVDLGVGVVNVFFVFFWTVVCFKDCGRHGMCVCVCVCFCCRLR